MIAPGLETLGDTAEQVAETLLLSGVKGRRNAADSCPVARWLHFTQGGYWAVSKDYVDRVEPKYTAYSATDGVAFFVIAFDAGLYPDLEEK